MKIRVFLHLIFCFCISYGFAQNEITENLNFERVIENLLPQQEYDIDYNDLYDRLFTLYSNPLNLNTLVRADLQSLFFLSEIQISGILEYREKYGKFISHFELLSIEGFDKETVVRLMPFVTVDLSSKESLIKSLKNPENHELFLRYQTTIERRKGYSPPDTTKTGHMSSRYAGGPQRLYARYLYSKAGDYSFGFTVEKDPGERILWEPQTSRYGLDYYSFHAMVENRGILKKIIIGDFSMDNGQGLVFGSGMRIGKGFEPISTIRRNNMGLRPYRSVYENKDFSGIAISANMKLVEFNIFYSHVLKDAIILSDTIDESDEFVTYLQTVGLHRTKAEIAGKHTVTDKSIGGNVNFKTRNKKIEIGLNGVYTKFDVPIRPGSKKYNQFEFRGLSNQVGSLYANYFIKNAHLFAEIAVSEQKGTAISAGVIASLSSQVQSSLHLRKYSKNFHSFYSESFGENTKVMNEQGIYWGLKILPVSRMIIAMYFDFYRFPWLKYRVDAPSSGRDFMISANYLVSENLKFRGQYRSKMKELTFKDGSSILTKILAKTTEKILVDMEAKIDTHVSMKTRLQFSKVNFNQQRTSGFILAQDIIYSRPRISFSARFAIFDSDNYDNRQYIYERDMLYVYSIPSFYNKGVRYYLLTKYILSKNISIWAKWSQTKYIGSDTVGSGLEEIGGNTKSNFSFQLRFRV